VPARVRPRRGGLSGRRPLGRGKRLSRSTRCATPTGCSACCCAAVLALGGIGLPGGAVYIRIEPCARACCAAWCRRPAAVPACWSPSAGPAVPARSVGRLGFHELAAGLALLLFPADHRGAVQLAADPGLDGFGISMPFLPRALAAADAVRPWFF
jgi:hypothetical protein